MEPSCATPTDTRSRPQSFRTLPDESVHARSVVATLVTHNEGEFGRVPGLLIENWLSEVNGGGSPPLRSHPMPFDSKRMIYGEFKMIVDASPAAADLGAPIRARSARMGSGIPCGNGVSDSEVRRLAGRLVGNREAGSAAPCHAETRIVSGAHDAVLEDASAIGHVTGQIEASVEVEVTGRR